MAFRTHFLAAAVLAAIPVGGAVAWGQNALDRNLQQNSGGVNPGGRKERPGARQDAIVTGNVGGLEGFRGNIDYRAPGEFSGHTSEDDNYNFRLHALPSNAYQGYYRGPSLLPRVENSNTAYLLRSGSGLTTGEVTGQYERFGGGAIYQTDASVLAYRRARQEALNKEREAARITGEPVAGDAAAVDQSIAIRSDSEGMLYEVIASPLRGVRERQIGKSLQLRVDQREGEEHRATESPEPVLHQQGRRIDDSIIPLSVMLGERLQPTGRRNGGGLTSPSYRYTPAELEEAILRPGDTLAVPAGADIYYDLLRKVGRPRKEVAYRPIEGDRIGASAKPRPRTQQEKVADEVARVEAESAKNEGTPDEQKAAMDRLVERLKYDATLKTLVSGADTPFDKTMAAAESQMAEGRYFEAESTYAQSMRMARATPLAAVGQAHAQLGAGLYVAAGHNLRVVFDRHPELIAARYEPPVLPAEPRLGEVTHELADLGKKEGKQPEVHLLTAYLAHQAADAEGVAAALDAMGRDDADDPLVPLLRKIWSAPRASGPTTDKPKAEPKANDKPEK